MTLRLSAQQTLAQPLIVSAGILSLKQLRSELAELPEQTAQAVNDKLVYAGHSVGEITAAYGAGVFSAETALRFVAKRAAAMQECALAADTSMAAVLGGDRENVLTKLTEHNLTAVQTLLQRFTQTVTAALLQAVQNT